MESPSESDWQSLLQSLTGGDPRKCEVPPLIGITVSRRCEAE
jgi:hypothetical protein